MDLLPLITIPALYFIVAFLKPYFQPKLPFNICSVCIAVSSTWLILLVLWLYGLEVSQISLGILMGMSVTGIMYKSEALYEKKKIGNFWFVRLVMIVAGFYAIYELLKRDWNLFLLIAIGSILVIAIATFFFQGITHRDVVEEQTKVGRKSSIIKRLDDCC